MEYENMSHIFEIRSISNEKPNILMEIPSISIRNLGFPSKYQGISNQKFGNTRFFTP